MAYQLLKLLPNDIVDFCITPFLTISESEVRANYQKVLRDIERGTLKGMTGLFYVIDDGIQPLPANMPADLVRLLQANASGNERYLRLRRQLIQDGHKAADLDQLTDNELEVLYHFQLVHNTHRQMMLHELGVRKSHAAWQEQFDILTTNGIQPPHPIAQIHIPHVIEDNDSDDEDNNEDDKLRVERLRAMVLDTSDIPNVSIRWIVGTTATGQKVCRMSTAYVCRLRDRQLFLVTKDGVQVSRYFGWDGMGWGRPRMMVLRSENPERYNRIVSLGED